MTPFEQALADHKKHSAAAVTAALEAQRLEAAVSLWAMEEAQLLIGTENPRTAKPHTWSSAQEYAKDLPLYRQKRDAVFVMHAAATRAQHDARQAELRAEYAIAETRSVTWNAGVGA